MELLGARVRCLHCLCRPQLLDGLRHFGWEPAVVKVLPKTENRISVRLEIQKKKRFASDLNERHRCLCLIIYPPLSVWVGGWVSDTMRDNPQ